MVRASVLCLEKTRRHAVHSWLGSVKAKYTREGVDFDPELDQRGSTRRRTGLPADKRNAAESRGGKLDVERKDGQVQKCRE